MVKLHPSREAKIQRLTEMIDSLEEDKQPEKPLRYFTQMEVRLTCRNLH